MHRLRRHRRLLNTALLVLVALGVLLQPMLGALVELHVLEHAAALQCDHGHLHDEGHGEPLGDDAAPGAPIGAHHLLHDGGLGASMALLAPAIRLASPVFPADPPPRDHAHGLPVTPLTLPFRPPIA